MNGLILREKNSNNFDKGSLKSLGMVTCKFLFFFALSKHIIEVLRLFSATFWVYFVPLIYNITPKNPNLCFTNNLPQYIKTEVYVYKESR